MTWKQKTPLQRGDNLRRSAIVSGSESVLEPGARVLVTGGAGFICSHVADHLLAAGYQVAIVDDLSTGDRRNLPPAAAFFLADVTSPSLREAFATFRPTAVVHGAAQVKVVRSMEEPALDLRVNVGGTLALLDLCRESGVRRVVLLSTGGAMYGDTEEAATEAFLPSPSSFYAVHKYTAERYVEMSGLSYGILRFSNIYGPRQRTDLEGGVVAIFLERLERGEPVTIFGTGEQARDFLYVEDAARAVLLAMSSPNSGLWNAGVGYPTTINQVLEALVRLYRPPVEVRHEPGRPGEIYRAWLDPSRIRADLGWTPRFSLEAGLLETIRLEGLVEPKSRG